MEFSRITIGDIEQNVLKGRYYTPADHEGVRQVIHPETNVNNVLNDDGKTLKAVLQEQAQTAQTYTDNKIAQLVGSAPDTLDTLQELAAALKDNADIIDTINSSIGLKADKSYVDTQLGLKANADQVYKKGEIDGKLNAKANADSVYTKQKVDELLQAKVSTETLEQKLADKVTTEQLTTALEDKADISYVDEAVAGKADSSALAGKADKSYVDTQLALKANTNDVYTKVQVDGKLAALPKVAVGETPVEEAEINTTDIYIQLF